MEHPLDEPQAIRRWREGDPEGLATLVHRYELRALRVAYPILQDRMDAEDAAQNAFLRAWQHRHRFDPERPFWPWFLRLVIRESQRIAGQRRSRPALAPGSEKDLWAVETQWKDHDPLPEEIAEQNESREALWRALRGLSPAQRTAVVLRYYEDLSEREIAEAMGCSVGAVKHYLYEARQRLRLALKSIEASSPAVPDP
ncbi:sigma-70 family RNA polymerase sigma factor [Thermoflexus sp.]|uniref:RNA polymerase sigma factor n=1 Tax=Thermoflexus sp. TaxID=1969742 RepID=UPI0025D10106|nr:sigma-70 family RNA polymerase sigma factor [Thermoflexus sp.]MDW8181095.1 sigma-70 family RNA polymerase sigma factor [Anaerolineae bacterium]MCS6962688.1 sigma-70 family RNA polymerase sigma factor [Thermoflexus sp.]MCS7351637.1 sigma-70 family RNA polymerase sigma factor [Thermoflexus sp.]MCX7691194.1 sigma-70 family RNA polymerase sigma factor [Thermoflexus sp.]MDW8184709.1 sigma-70 family RNA polymerase sigma factor [Anaerolineae bacterium]